MQAWTALLLLGIISTAIPGLHAEIKCGVVNTMYPEANVIFPIRNYNYVGPYHCNYTFIPPVGYNANIKCQALKIDPSDQDETCPIHSFEIFDKKYCGSTANDSFFEQKSSANPIIIRIDATSPEASGSYDCKLTTDYERCSCGRLKTGTHDEFAHAAEIKWAEKHNQQLTGGGVIITEKSVLTTRSTLSQFDDDHKQAAVWVGVDTLNKKKLEVNNFIYSNSFDGQLNLRDIAIVKLRYEMHFNGDVGLACLLFNYPAPNPGPFQGEVLQVDETTLKNTVGSLTYKGSLTDVTNIVETTHGGEHGCKVLLGSGIVKYVEGKAYVIGIARKDLCLDHSNAAGRNHFIGDVLIPAVTNGSDYPFCPATTIGGTANATEATPVEETREEQNVLKKFLGTFWKQF